ncbi:MAG: biotin--[acetyl-CoA-carboxylase] ligase [Acidobacteriaceae bacterium]
MDLRRIESALSGTVFDRKVHVFARVESTNALAVKAAMEGAPEGTLFVADAQTAGRGRGGHGWHSEAGTGLYLSFVLRPAKMIAREALWLSLAAGAAVHDGVREATGISADLRWPNDLLVGSKKFCGILAEQQSEGEDVRFMVVGIGINVNHAEFPPELNEIATSLRIVAGREQDRIKVLELVLRAFDREYRRLLHPPRGSAGEELLQRLPRISTWISGKQVHVPEQGGYDGVTAGLDQRGFLLVRTAQGMRTVLSGGVREPL